jgi:hypothetical protein
VSLLLIIILRLLLPLHAGHVQRGNVVNFTKIIFHAELGQGARSDG